MPCPLTRINTLRRQGFPIPPKLREAHRQYGLASKKACRKRVKLITATSALPYPDFVPKFLRFDYLVQTVGAP